MLKSWIVPQLKQYEHKIYCEPFGGGASVLLHKEPAEVEIYNDLNSDLVNFFRILADQKQFKKFQRIVSVLPSSRELYNEYRREWQAEIDPIARAAKWFYIARLSFGGKFGQSWGYTVLRSNRGKAGTVSSWLGAVEGLPAVHQRLQRVQIECLPALEVIGKYDTPETLFYFDPPYILETRKGGKAYEYEMTDADHAELVEMILNLKGKACLSGYEHPIYRPLLNAGWTMGRKETCCMAVGRTRGTGLQGAGSVTARQKRTECLYLSPLVRTEAAQGSATGKRTARERNQLLF